MCTGAGCHFRTVHRRRALDLLLAALADPRPIGPEDVPDAARLAWRDEQLTILDHLSGIVETDPEPFAHLRIANGLVWHARRSRAPEVRERAAGIIAAIPDTFGWRLARAVAPGDSLALLDDDPPTGDWSARRTAACTAVARELVAAVPDPGAGLALLDECFRSCLAWQERSASCEVLWALARTDAAYAGALVELLLAAPDRPVAGCLSALLIPLRDHDGERAVALAWQAVASGDATVCTGVAAAYSRGWAAVASAEEMELLVALFTHPDRDVRRNAIEALRPLGRHRPEAAVTLALRADIGDDPALADALAEQFDPEFGLGLDSLSDADLVALLNRFLPVPSIDGWSLGRFLSAASVRAPEAAVTFLLCRIALGDEERLAGYRALPYRDDLALPGLAASPRYANLLRQIRDASLGAGWLRGSWLAELYAAASQRYDATGLAVLAEWLDTGDPRQLAAVGQLLREAPREFVFAQAPFVARLLSAATAAGEECYREVAGQLYASSALGSKTGSPGQPFPEDLELRERAAAQLANLPVGGPAHRFYTMLLKEAGDNIAAAALENEEMDEL